MEMGNQHESENIPIPKNEIDLNLGLGWGLPSDVRLHIEKKIDLYVGLALQDKVFQRPLKSKTVVMAAKYEKGLVIGIRCVPKLRPFFGPVTNMVTRLCQSIFILQSDGSPKNQAFTDEMVTSLTYQKVVARRELSVYEIANCFSQRLLNEDCGVSCNFIIAGYQEGLGPDIYIVVDNGTMVSMDAAVDGYGAENLNEVLLESWKNDMNEEQCKQFVKEFLEKTLPPEERDSADEGEEITDSETKKKKEDEAAKYKSDFLVASLTERGVEGNEGWEETFPDESIIMPKTPTSVQESFQKFRGASIPVYQC